MAIRTYKVTLDTKNSIAPEPVFLRQGDKTGAVVIDATLMDNGAPVSLEGLTPMLKANTADGQAVIADSTGFNIVNYSGGEFTYQVPNALSSVPGKIMTAYFSFSDASGSESTFDVAFIIKKAVDITKPQADDYITIIDGTIQSLQQKIDAMNTDVQTILDAFNKGDFYSKAQTDSKLDDEHAQVTAQLQQTEQEVMRKRELEDLSSTVLSAIEGGGGTAFNLLSVPQDNSVSRAKLNTELKSEIEKLMPTNPNVNVMEKVNSATSTVSYFGAAANTSYSETIENGLKTYSVDTTSAYSAGGKPSINIGNITYDVKPNTEYVFTCDVLQSTAKGVFTFFIKNGTTTLDTQYGGFNAGETSEVKAFTTPAGANNFEISLFGFNEAITGEHHIKITNLDLRTTLPQPKNIVDRVSSLESNLSEDKKSYFILDFDYGPQSWEDSNIKITLDEYGYPFKFNYGQSSDGVIARALVRRGCEMATYFNDAAYLPTTAQLSSTDPTDIAKVDAYVKGAIDMQEALGFKDQLVWSTRQFTTGINLENALKKYGFVIERLRTSGTMLPTSFSKNQLTKIHVSDNTTNWYEHTMTGIDTAIANGGSLAIFTHKIVPTDDASGINIIESQYRLILNKIKGYVDAGQAEVVTYRDYFEMFKEV